MGQQATCTLRFGSKVSRGTALLESSELIFRGDTRRAFPFREMKSVEAVEGELRFEFSGAQVRVQLGLQAGKWAHKILNPPSLLDRLGVKLGLEVGILNIGDKRFELQLRQRGARIAKGKPRKDSDLIFFGAEEARELRALRELEKFLKPAGAVWVVYPKGRKEITEAGVMAAGKAAGLVDVKVCSFSATHTALKFVIPTARR